MDIAEPNPILLPGSARSLSSAPGPEGGAQPSALPGLTPAEARVLALIREGLSNKEISTALAKAEPTVKHQVSSILRKAGVPSRARLIALLR